MNFLQLALTPLMRHAKKQNSLTDARPRSKTQLLPLVVSNTTDTNSGGSRKKTRPDTHRDRARTAPRTNSNQQQSVSSPTAKDAALLNLCHLHWLW